MEKFMDTSLLNNQSSLYGLFIRIYYTIISHCFHKSNPLLTIGIIVSNSEHGNQNLKIMSTIH